MLEHTFDNPQVNSTPEPPDIRPTKHGTLQPAGSYYVDAFQPVIFRMDGRWRFGLIDQWVRVKDHSHPWIARMQYGEPGAQSHFDYLDDGAIIPLQLDTSTDPPTLKPSPHKKAEKPKRQ